jgi:hypothetical protein
MVQVTAFVRSRANDVKPFLRRVEVRFGMQRLRGEKLHKRNLVVTCRKQASAFNSFDFTP